MPNNRKSIQDETDEWLRDMHRNFDRLELVLIFQWVTVMALVIGLYFRT